jgi:hypothetical protein
MGKKAAKKIKDTNTEEVRKYTLENGTVITSSLDKKRIQTITMPCTNSSSEIIKLTRNISDLNAKGFNFVMLSPEAKRLDFVVTGPISSLQIIYPTSEECKLTHINIDVSKTSIESLHVDASYPSDTK